jgi:hypothetical protein
MADLDHDQDNAAPGGQDGPTGTNLGAPALVCSKLINIMRMGFS